jgi:hypothetical protein
VPVKDARQIEREAYANVRAVIEKTIMAVMNAASI